MVARIRLVDEEGNPNGQWFDKAAAQSFEEDTWFDGSNRVSMATGSQFGHQELFLTASGAWVLCEWSQWQGSQTTYRRISAQEAAAWFTRNQYETGQIPESLHELVKGLEV